MNLTPAQAQHAFIPLMVLTMSAVISLVLTIVQQGLDPAFPRIWLRQWTISFSVGLPAALLLVPLIRGGLARVTVPTPSRSRTLQHDLIRACANGAQRY